LGFEDKVLNAMTWETFEDSDVEISVSEGAQDGELQFMGLLDGRVFKARVSVRDVEFV
jgi:hypothetical protein